MTDQNNMPAELGPIARELLKLADELRELAEKPVFELKDVANDDNSSLTKSADTASSHL